MIAGAKFFLASLGISRDTHQICVMRSGKVREKCAEKVRESQGIQIELTGGNPVSGFSLRGNVVVVKGDIGRGQGSLGSKS